MRRVQAYSPNIFEVYTKIRSRRPAWFHACPMIDPDDYESFCEWVRRKYPNWYEDEDCVVFVHREGHVAECHLAFLGKVNMDFLREVVARLEKDGTRRIEVPLAVREGLLVRKLLRGLDFQCEGTMRGKTARFSPDGHIERFLDVEMWARLASERLQNG